MRTANRKAAPMTGAQRGFTLVEMLIVIVIVGILTAIAIPSYQNYVRRTYRTDAMGALQALAQSMERHYVQNGNSYAGADDSGKPKFFPTTAPIDGGTPRYNLTINATSSAYTLRATPVGAQAGDGFIELLSTGERRWDKDNNGSIGSGENTWDDH